MDYIRADAFDDFIERTLYRQRFLAANVPYCMRCGTQQVQLIGKDEPAQWKCRRCKLSFGYEPS